MSNPTNVTVCKNVNDDEYFSLALHKSVEVSNFLGYFLKTGTDLYPEDDILYGEAVFAWELNGKDPFWFYATKDPVLLKHRGTLHKRFGLQILSLEESVERQKHCPFGDRMRFGDVFQPFQTFKS
jgi:hypothetical protein